MDPVAVGELTLDPVRSPEDISLNVKDYGARGDGVTDDTQAILNAEAARLAINGELYFPPGRYRCAIAALQFTQGPIFWRGAGLGSVLDFSQATTLTGDMLKITGSEAASGTRLQTLTVSVPAGLNPTTSDATNGSNVIANVGDTSPFFVGNYVRVSGAGPASSDLISKITALTATSLTLEDNASTTQVATQVQFEPVLAVADSSAFTAGDLVKVYSSAQFDPGGTNTKIGELARVKVVGSGTVTLQSPLTFAYATGDTAKVAKMTPVTGVYLRDLTIKGGDLASTTTTTLTSDITAAATTIQVASTSGWPTLGSVVIDGEKINYSSKTATTITVNPTKSNGRGVFGTTAAAHAAGATVTVAPMAGGIKLIACEIVRLDDVRFEGCTAEALGIYDCRDVYVKGPSAFRSRRWGSGYGIDVVDASCDVTIDGLHADQCRHAFTTGSTSTGHGIPTRVKVVKPYVWSTVSSGDALDTHGAGWDIEFIDPTVFSSSGSGLNIECAHARVRGGWFYDCANHGVYFHNETAYPTDIEIDGVRVYGSGLGNMGIRVTNGATAGAGSTVKRVRISNFYVEAANSRSVYVVSADTWRFKNVEIDGGVIVNPNSYGVQVQKADDITIRGVIATGLKANTYGIHLNDVNRGSIGGNVLNHSSTTTSRSIFCASAGDCVFYGNIGTGAATGLQLDNSCANCKVDVSNNFRGCSATYSLGTGTGHATGDSKPTITGSRGGNAALASLLTALGGAGLITDSSTA